MQGLRNFRTYFFRGMAALLPTILTIWIFIQCYTFIRENISTHINNGVVHVLVASIDEYPYVTEDEKRAYALGQEPELQGNTARLNKRIAEEDVIRGTRVQKAREYWVYGAGQITGFILALVGVCFVGAFLASVAGKSLWHLMERMFMGAPLVKKVYPYIKQITDFVLTRKDLSFNRVVAIQYPREGLWSIALVTGSGLKKIVVHKRQEFLTVFVPSSPTPFTGYVIMIPSDSVIELEMTIEEALRFTVSGGVITPAEHKAFRAMTNKESDVSV